MTYDIEAALRQAAADAEARIANCHEHVHCPRCLARVGVRCRRAVIDCDGHLTLGRTLKHPHRERWTQVVPAR